MRVTHKTPDINRVQITFVAQIEYNSPAEPFYAPWFFVCLPFVFCFYVVCVFNGISYV